jgi:hypothetical protein
MAIFPCEFILGQCKYLFSHLNKVNAIRFLPFTTSLSVQFPQTPHSKLSICSGGSKSSFTENTTLLFEGETPQSYSSKFYTVVSSVVRLMAAMRVCNSADSL